LLAGARLVLTDSGGIQEETTALNVPCLTLRDNTERPITVEQGTNTLVGRNRQRALECADDILRSGGSEARYPSSGTAMRATASLAICRLLSAFRHARRGGECMNMPAPSAAVIVNALTIDVEDYFQVSAFAQNFSRATWDSVPCRIEANIERILELLTETEARATFFTLGWVAERYPAWSGALSTMGTSLQAMATSTTARPSRRWTVPRGYSACQGNSRGPFRLRGARIPGAQLSVGPANPWAFDCIAEAGYRYSSSVYPIRHDHYGAPKARALRMRCGRACSNSGGHRAHAVHELACRRRRLLSPVALSRFAVVAAPHQRDRRAAGDVLLPPVGARPDQPRVEGLGAKPDFAIT
jgi:polysaccharide deacetylase family protein (PEP-CTERM system associated)